MKVLLHLSAHFLVFLLTISFTISTCSSQESSSSSSTQSKTEDSEPSPLVQLNNSVEIDRLFDRAFEAQANENYVEAELIWNRILELNSDSQIEATAYNNLGDILYEQEKLNEAVEAYQNSIETDPNFFMPRLSLGLSQNQLGDIEEAQISLDKSRELLPEELDSLESLSYYRLFSIGLRKIDRFHESIQVIRQAIHLNPYVANGATCELISEPLTSLGISITVTIRQYRSARCELRIHLVIDPESQEPSQNLQEYFNEMQQMVRNHILEQSNYAEIYQKVGLEEPEVILARHHTLFQPNYPNEKLDEASSITHFNLGLSLLNRAFLTDDSTSMEEAIASFQDSLEYNSAYPWTYIYLSIALIAQEQLEEAISTAHQVFQLSNVEAMYNSPTSSHAWAHNILGYAFQRQGNSNAISEYQTAIQLDETFITAQNNLREIQSLNP